MTKFAWYDGNIIGHHTCEKKRPAFSFYSKVLDILRIGHGGCPYKKIVIEYTYFQMRGKVLWNSQKIMDGQRYILKMLAESLNIPLIEYSPTSIKKSFTGNGRADKEDMMSECKKRGIKVETHDEADSVGLWYHHLLTKK